MNGGIKWDEFEKEMALEQKCAWKDMSLENRWICKRDDFGKKDEFDKKFVKEPQ